MNFNNTKRFSEEREIIDEGVKRLNDFKIRIFEALINFLGNSIHPSVMEAIFRLLDDRYTEVLTAYGIVKEKFKYRTRDSRDPYITHIDGVINNYITYFYKFEKTLEELDHTNENDIKKAIQLIKREINIIGTLIDHDSIEDTDITREGLKQRFTNNRLIPYATELLSKQPFYIFIDEDEDQDIIDFKTVIESGILNSNFTISDRINNKLRNNSNDNHFIQITTGENYELSPIEIEAIQIYIRLKSKYKKIRNETFSKNFSSIKSLKEYARKIGFNSSSDFVSENDLNSLIYIVIVAKLCDRFNNLDDILIAWSSDPERIESKLVETEKYLCELAKEFDPLIYAIMVKKITEIRREIQRMKTIEQVKTIVG